MDLPRRKRRVQRRQFIPEFNIQFNEGKITQSGVVDANLSYMAFLNEFVFEKPKENKNETDCTSSWFDTWEEVSMDADDGEVFRSTSQYPETNVERNSAVRPLRVMEELFHSVRRPSSECNLRHSKRSDYGSMTSTSPSSNRESLIPEEVLAITTSRECSMDSGCELKSSVGTGSSDYDSENELLRYFTYDFYDVNKLLSEVLLAVSDCETSYPSNLNSMPVQYDSKSEVKTFLEDIFEVSTGKMEEIYLSANMIKVAKVILNVKVLEAKIQRPKLLIGGGSLFVKITIQNTNQKFKTRKERETLNPKWNQDFILDPNSWCTDVLSLEVWNVFESHNFQRILQKGKKEKLIGSLQVPVKNFRENEVEDWYPITNPKPTNTEKEPSIIRLRCEARTADDQVRNRNRQGYDALLARVVFQNLRARSNGEDVQPDICPRWSGDLKPLARTTMEQYSVFLGLKDPDVHLSWWLICSTVPSVDYDYLFELLMKVQGHVRRKSYNETDLDQLTSSFCNWIKLALDEFKLLRINFDPFLRILVNLQSYFESNRLLKSNDAILDLLPQVEAAMTDYVKEWWSNMVEKELRGVLTPEDQLKAVVGLTSETVSFLEEISKHYGSTVLGEANLHFFQNTFTLLIQNLKQCVIPPLTITYNQLNISNEMHLFLSNDKNENVDFANELGQQWKKLYDELGSLHRMSFTFSLEVPSESGICGYHKWFRGAVQHWVNLLKQRSLPLITTAVELDTFGTVDEFCNFSSSAVDVLDILSAVKKWWINLTWPEPESSLVILPMILQVVCSCKTTYIDRLMNKVKIVLNDNPDKSFNNYKRVCTALNSIERVRHELLSMFEAHVATSKNFISQVKEKKSASSFISYSGLIIENSVENIKFESNELIEMVIEKIGDSLQCKALGEDCEMHETIMVDFFDPLFKVIHHTMNDKNFQWFIRRFWEVFVGLVDTMVLESSNGGKGQKHEPTFFKEIDLITEEMLRFVSPADGVGLPKDISLSQDYLALKKKLRYLKMSSESLISAYFSERFDEQDNRNIPCTAKLVVRTYFPSPGKLTVDIIMAEDIEFNPMGGCLPFVTRHREHADSFVTAELVPTRTFQGVQNARTKIQLNSDPAVFNEKFNLETEESIDSRHDEEFILFSLRAMHRRRSSIFIGEAVIPLKTVSDNTQNIYLKLTKPGTDDGYQTLSVLKQRTSDSIATSFLKERSLLLYSPMSLKLFE